VAEERNHYGLDVYSKALDLLVFVASTSIAMT